ncbi:MAG: flagellar basal body rod protein FlgC [Thermoanaerobacteraceae bacterium]|jgi:flagellar basal-body rod protein FlgC|nr:flagellar basal body rod protein FlgC [Thermoanaerobacteraceae bacterium]HHV71201.1 flagellar basal body rod protein FlgC [Clostridia bacterium]
MNLFTSFAISASGLTAQRLRMDIISNNIANAQTTRTEQGGPYKRQVAVFVPIEQDKSFRSYLNNSLETSSKFGGVRVAAIREDQSPPKLIYDPNHPDANEQGYVAYPNVDLVKEMVDMIGATRAYQANVTAVNSAKAMFLKALEISR